VALARGTERRLGRVQAGLARRDPTAEFRLALAEMHRLLGAWEPDTAAEAAVLRELRALCARAFDSAPLGAEELEALRARVGPLFGRLREGDGAGGPAEAAGSARRFR
jgi:hypothetical protein